MIFLPDSRKIINVSLFGDSDNVPLHIEVMHVRFNMKKVRKLPGGARLCVDSFLTGFNRVPR